MTWELVKTRGPEWHTEKFGGFPMGTWNTCQGLSGEVASSV